MNKMSYQILTLFVVVLLASTCFGESGRRYHRPGKFIHKDGHVTTFVAIDRYGKPVNGTWPVVKGIVEGRRVSYPYELFQRFVFLEKEKTYGDILHWVKGKEVQNLGTLQLETNDGRTFIMENSEFRSNPFHRGIIIGFKDPVTGELRFNTVPVEDIQEIVFDDASESQAVDIGAKSGE
jgi:hypothetical protein